LGVMMFEMLEGELPYKGETPLATVLMHQTEMVPSISKRYPSELRKFVERLMEKKREGRPAAAEDMLTELKGIMPGDITLSGFDISRPPHQHTKKTLQSSLAVKHTPPDTRDLVNQVRLSTEQPVTNFQKFTLIRPRIALALTFVVAAVIAVALYVDRSADDRGDSANESSQVAESGQDGSVDEASGATEDERSEPPVSSGQTDQMSPQPDIRNMEIQTVPAGAAIHINNRYEGRSPVLVPLRVGFSETLLVQLDGFEDYLGQVEVTAETEELDPIILTQSMTELVITSDPPGADVIDLATEQSLGETELRIEIPQSTEVLDLELRLDQYQPVSRQVIPNRAVVTIHAELAEIHRPSSRDDNDDDDDGDSPETGIEGGLFGQPVD